MIFVVFFVTSMNITNMILIVIFTRHQLSPSLSYNRRRCHYQPVDNGGDNNDNNNDYDNEDGDRLMILQIFYDIIYLFGEFVLLG